MSCPKTVFVVLFAMLFSASCFAVPVPARAESGNEFDINISATAVLFNPAPWVSTSPAWMAYFIPYATEDYTEGYSGQGSGYNLATTIFIDHQYSTSDSTLSQASGDLAVLFGNQVGKEITFAETVVTIDFKRGAMDIYLPQFSLTAGDEMHFWVASDGSTYFANITDGIGSSGGPNLSADESITGGHVAATPEPATLLLLGLGSVLLRRKK